MRKNSEVVALRLYDAWKRISLDKQGNPVKHVWDEYLALEKGVYENILRNNITRVEGSAEEIGAQFGISAMHAAAFLDGIHEAVDGVPNLDELEEKTQVAFDIGYERLYKKMVEYKAEKLYTLPEWDTVFTKEQQKQFYTEQKNSHTIRRNEAKVGRNDPCPCGSGKKYKKCCGN